jgi:DNA-binding MarR family transcriptional regulator
MQEQLDQASLAKCSQVAAVCACFNFRKASRAVTQLYDEILQSSGLLATQFTLLIAIAIAGSATITRLAQELVMDRTTLTRNLKPLERQRLIEIKPGQDQRTRVVMLTDAGREALAKAIPLWEQAQANVVEGLGQKRWNTLLAGLSDTVLLIQET